MGEKADRPGFDGNLWFENQVRRRTRAALNAQGSKASCGSVEYCAEYKKQQRLFRAERAAVKERKQEKYLKRLEKQTKNSGFSAE